MIFYRELSSNDVENLKDIDRSEQIDLIYEMQHGEIVEVAVGHECPSWNQEQLTELKARFQFELNNGGKAYGAFDKELLVGFAVLAHQFRGENQDQLQVDLMYVSRNYRRQGIATRLMDELSREAKKRGAKSLYISSTETESAVNFYRSTGSVLTGEVDQELFEREPKDIHMIRKL
ncbi:GNAT family N-acetyltransferase [Paenibacillus puldeungensis]|uniref:GNAT family N-acetyltransferase n=1 Tax=Paenibacillus puldeungensis TaxID=696536 RepID=A0ABW3RWT2_9BACL